MYKLARKYHPDTNKEKDAQEKFVEIQAAYDVCFAESDLAFRHLILPRPLATRESVLPMINTVLRLSNQVLIRTHSRAQGLRVLALADSAILVLRFVQVQVVLGQICLSNYLVPSVAEQAVEDRTSIFAVMI